MNDILTHFVNEIIKTETVFCLEDKNGIAFSESVLFQDDNGQGVPVICFWATHTLAKESCVDAWANYTINEMCLTTFIEDWLVQIYNDSLIVGLNFNKEMLGLECDPLDLILAITKILKLEKRDLEFEHFKNIADLEKQISALIG